MSTQHTKEPWIVSPHRPGDKELFIPEAGIIIDIDDCTEDERAERFANANIAAAAPDLLEALLKYEEIAQICERGEPMTATESMRLSREAETLRRAALRKAQPEKV